MNDFLIAPISTLHQILAEEREELRRGRLHELEKLAHRKEEALTALADHPTPHDPEELSKLDRQVKHNAEMLDAARAGVQSVRQRLAETLKVNQGAQTYGQDGKRRWLSGGSPSADRSV